MKALKSYLKEFHNANETILEAYISLWNEFEVPKKQPMIVPGQIERHFYFVLSGIQKSFYFHKGKEHIIAFAYPPSFSGIPESFLTQSPSKYYLETISESKFLRISYEQHQKFMIEHRDIETLYRKITEFFLKGVVQRQHEVMALSMEERFRIFVGRSAHLLQAIPQKDIASYLNIDPTNFSKLINKIRI
ncbi:MAG: Crp/Fnr family transcriptional regulator [Bacteroidota bacterium]